MLKDRVLKRMFSLSFRQGRKSPVERWCSSRLQRARDALARIQAELDVAEPHFEQVAARHDYAAARELEVIRPKLDDLFQQRDVWARDVAIQGEVERIVNDTVLPLYIQKRGELDRWYERIVENPDVLDEDEYAAFSLASLELERMRQVIASSVGEDAAMLDVTRGFDYPSGLHTYWEAVHRGRERLKANHGAGYKVRLRESPTWFGAADRLAQLRAAGAARKEAVYAVR
jgi:hypothetical protein